MIKRSAATLTSVTEGLNALRKKYKLTVSLNDKSASKGMNEFDALKWSNWVAQREVLQKRAEANNPVRYISSRIYGMSSSNLSNNEVNESLAA